MKILALADRPPHLSMPMSIPEICQQENIDLICTLGDLEMADIATLEQIKNIPKIGVYGNHCSGQYMEPLGITNMHLNTLEVGGFTFGGFEGSVRYKPGSAPMFTQEEATELMTGFPAVDIFLCHCPPYGINDEPEEIAHQGFYVLRQYLDQMQPKMLMHGHTYPTEETIIKQYGPTKIEYVFGHKIIHL